MIPAGLVYPLAALTEIVGCFAIWAWWRGASLVWLVPGMASLMLFRWLLAQVNSDFTGRAPPAMACVAGAAVILAASRA